MAFDPINESPSAALENRDQVHGLYGKYYPHETVIVQDSDNINT